MKDCLPLFREEAVISLLARVPGFERLDAKELEQLEAVTEKKRYPANTAVFFQDDPADALYILISGSAKAFQTSEDGKDRILRIIKPGNAFGDLAMIAGKPRFLTVQTLEDSEMLRLTQKDFVAFADKHTWVLWTLLRAYADRINRKNEDLLDLSFRYAPAGCCTSPASWLERERRNTGRVRIAMYVHGDRSRVDDRRHGGRHRPACSSGSDDGSINDRALHGPCPTRCSHARSNTSRSRASEHDP